MMKKQIGIFLLTAGMLAGLVGCGGNATDAQEVSQEETEQAENVSKQEEAEETEQAAETEETAEEEKTEDGKMATGADVTIPELSPEAKEIPDNEAFAFIKDMKVGWNLGNTLDAYSDGANFKDELKTEECWGNPVTTKDMIDSVKEAGFDTIRIPVTWHGHVSREGDQIVVSQVWLDRVKEVVDYAYDNGMYVIVNTHHDLGEEGYYPDSDHYDQSEAFLKAVWTRMAETFRDYDEHLILESLNEPRLSANPTYEWNFQAGVKECQDAADCINRLNQAFVDTVRATGGNNADRYLLLPGYDAALAGVATDLYKLPQDSADNKLIVSVHAYTPYNFALQAMGESGAVDSFDIGSTSSTKDIDDLMDTLYTKYVSQGIPVLIGEFGARNKDNNIQDRVNYYAYYVSEARAHGISCCIWDNGSFSGNGEQFGMLRRYVGKWFYSEILDTVMKYA